MLIFGLPILENRFPVELDWRPPDRLWGPPSPLSSGYKR